MEPIGRSIELLSFKHTDEMDELPSQFILNSEASEIFTSFLKNQDNSEMQPIAVISIIGKTSSHNCRLINHIFDSVRFDESDENCKIEMWSRPVEVLDQRGMVIKAFIFNCICDDDEDIKNGMMAFSLLFSSYTIVNISGDLFEESKVELYRINNLIESLRENSCFESDDQLIDQLPSLIWVSREKESGENEYENEIISWQHFESILNSELNNDEINSLTTLSYIQNKDYCRLPDHSTSTPFCEGIQDIRRKVSNCVNPIRLGGYLINCRMYWDLINILVEHINSGLLPNYHQVFDSIVDKEITLNVQEANAIFEKEFVQKLNEIPEECKIDERYHAVANMIMKNFKKQLDPDLNIGEEINQIFNRFSQTYNHMKQESKCFDENLDYSESINESEINEDQNSKEEISQDEDFNINMLNSEFDHTGQVTVSLKQKDDTNMLEVVNKLKEQLKEKEEKIKDYEKEKVSDASKISETCSSPVSSSSKDYMSLKQQLNHAENELKKKTALFENECKYLSNKIEDSGKTIEKLKDNINEQREKFNKMLKDNNSKFDRDLHNLQSKLEESQAKVLELQGDLYQKNTKSKIENKITKIKELEYRLEKLKIGQDEQFQIESLKSEDTYSQLRKQISDLELENKTIKRDFNEKHKQLISAKAILEQRVSFLEQEKLDFQQKLTDRSNTEDSIINMIKKRYDEEQQDIRKDFIDTLTTKESEITELKDSLKRLKEYYEEQIKNVNSNSEEVAAEYTSRLQEIERVVRVKDKKIEELLNKNEDLEYMVQDSNQKHLEDNIKEFEELKTLNDALKTKVKDLEIEVQNADQARKSHTFKMNSETEDKINQIKEVYEAEKKQFQNKLKKIRSDNEEEIKLIQEEYEEKIIQSNIHHEEEISFIQGQLKQVQEELLRTTESFESQIIKLNQEKVKLQDKIDEVKSEGVLKEKSISTLESHKESLEGLLKERDDIIEKLDSELDEAYNHNNEEKELIKKLKEEMNEQKFEQEKAIALINQENEYLEDKVKQLEQQLVDLTVEYEERASSMKNKIKDLKIHKLKDGNRDKENENRYNCTYNINDEKLEDILNMKLTFIPDFYFVKVRSILSSKPKKKNKENCEALKTFNDYDIYEIEVNDEDTDSNYVIERTSYQIFGLFKRLKKQYNNKSLSYDYKFPENLNEVLFQSQYGDNSKSSKDKEMYCSKDLRQITIQHYLNEICKQEVFKKSLELSSFFETARFKYGL